MSVAPANHREKVALILNRHSRMVRNFPPYVDHLEKAFGDRGPFIASQNLSELPAAIADLTRANPHLVFIVGGDGTLRQTLSHLIAGYGTQPLPRIAVLRGGTMNTVATSLGIFRSPLEQLEYILYRHDNGIPHTTSYRSLLSVNGYYGFILGIGGFSRFVEFYQSSHDPTPAYAFRLLARTIVSMLSRGELASSLFPEFKVNVWRDRKPWLSDATVTNISASTIRHIGFHFKPYYGAEERDGSFGLIVFKALPHRLVFHLPKFFLGKPISDPEMLQVPAQELLVKVTEPMRPMLDGDILKEEKEFKIQSGPSLEMVVA